MGQVSTAKNLSNGHISVNEQVELFGKLEALNKSQAVIEFDLDGTIITANSNFLKTMGYSLEEIQGKHHSLFADSDYKESEDYKNFWTRLKQGEYDSGQYKRIGKNGAEVWIQASYNPIFDEKGKPYKVVKFATDISEEKSRNAEFESKMAAIDKAQAVIEFDLEGNILTANENFLRTMGYKLEEVQGQHHRIFAEPEYVTSVEYKQFWQKLKNGVYDSGQYKRIGKNGKEVWIQASYNPIFDASGVPYKVVKFATDITDQVVRNAFYEGQINAIDKSQAVIEFNMDGIIENANSNFLKTMGYSLDEIQGKHHSLFATPEYAASKEYKEFWQKLNQGEFDAGKYKRIGKNGKTVWIQASYNPIFNLNGRPVKVVKYATDLTEERKSYNDLVESFKLASDQLASASEELSSTAKSMAQNAEKTSKDSSMASEKSEEVSAGVNIVATNTEEMTASIKEVATASSEASSRSKLARDQAGRANQIVNDLGRASEEIGNVIKVISSIAQQTNLLALNATIEAARAGDAGKGFAVVASEVKELAKQTAIATEDITHKISNVQEGTGLAVTAISEVNLAIEKLNEIAIQTAAAVEEQSASTNEVARIIDTSRQGVEEIDQLIKTVALAAGESAAGAHQTLSAASDLSTMAASLNKLATEAQKE